MFMVYCKIARDGMTIWRLTAVVQQRSYILKFHIKLNCDVLGFVTVNFATTIISDSVNFAESQVTREQD